MNPRRPPLVCLLTLTLAAAASIGWHHEGHSMIAKAGVRLLPDDVPAWFREGGGAIAHASLDPDQWRHALAPQLTRAEAPNHYFHFELFEGRALPDSRERYLELLAQMKLAPGDAGFLPYAIAESTQRLMMAFAEHRRWPDNPHVRSKCLFYAGLLAHYTGDLAQPLHCTVHWDGRADPETHRVTRTGIHTRVDGLLIGYGFDDLPLGDAPLEPAGDLMQTIHDAMRRSNAKVDRVFELEAELPKRKGDDLTPAWRELALERAAHGATLTAQMMLTAWRNSAHVDLPIWLDRAVSDGE